MIPIRSKTITSFVTFALLLGAGIFAATYETTMDKVNSIPLSNVSDDSSAGLSTQPPEVTSTAQTPESLALILRNSQFVMVRTSPEANSSIVTRVAPGVTVTVLQKESGDLTHPTVSWYYVRLPDGTQGWIRSDMLNIYWPPPPTGTREQAVSSIPSVSWKAGTRLKVNNPNGVWLRRSPSSWAGQVATLAFQNLVTSTGNKHFDGQHWWWEVRADWGAVGWVEQGSLIPA